MCLKSGSDSDSDLLNSDLGSDLQRSDPDPTRLQGYPHPRIAKTREFPISELHSVVALGLLISSPSAIDPAAIPLPIGDGGTPSSFCSPMAAASPPPPFISSAVEAALLRERWWL